MPTPEEESKLGKRRDEVMEMIDRSGNLEEKIKWN
jgi:hypothetical protein